jgi:hypothetical protein
MTTNQLAYLKYMEDVRSHKAQESLDTAKTAAQVSQAESAAKRADVEEAKMYNVPIKFGPLQTEIKLGSMLTTQDQVNKKASLQDYLNNAIQGGYVYGERSK